jgi:NAD-dependent dihydropyrimidine dehydrogenase PreA subunit/nitroreductase
LRLKLDSEKCTRCGDCVKICPALVFEQKELTETPAIVNESLCIGCAQCMMICPVDAISVPGYSVDEIGEIGKLPNPEEIANLILSRRSVRNFTDQRVNRALLEKIVLLADSAPSADNSRSTEFTILQNPESIKLVEQYTAEGLQKMIKVIRNPFMRLFAKRIMGDQYLAMKNLLQSIAEFVLDPNLMEKHWLLHGASTLIAFHGQPTKMGASVNAQLCVQNALIAIHGLGLGGFYSGFVSVVAPRDKRLLELFKVPETNKLYAVVVLGHPKIKFTRYVHRKTPSINWD